MWWSVVDGMGQQDVQKTNWKKLIQVLLSLCHHVVDMDLVLCLLLLLVVLIALVVLDFVVFVQCWIFGHFRVHYSPCEALGR